MELDCQSRCALDLLLFFSRHPRVFLTPDRFVSFLGYAVMDVARALERLVASAILDRRPGRTPAAVMYCLADHGSAHWARGIIARASQGGRRQLRIWLRARELRLRATAARDRSRSLVGQGRAISQRVATDLSVLQRLRMEQRDILSDLRPPTIRLSRPS